MTHAPDIKRLAAENARLRTQVAHLRNVLQGEQHWMHVLGLEARETAILEIILRDGILSHDKARQLYAALEQPTPSEALIWTHISRIRRKLVPHDVAIQNAPRQGWFIPPESLTRLLALRDSIVAAAHCKEGSGTND